MEIAEVTSDRDGKRAQWLKEKEVIVRIQQEQVPDRRAAHRIGARSAKGDLGRAAEIHYGARAQASRRSSKKRAVNSGAFKTKGSFLKEEVTDEDIAPSSPSGPACRWLACSRARWRSCSTWRQTCALA